MCLIWNTRRVHKTRKGPLVWRWGRSRELGEVVDFGFLLVLGEQGILGVAGTWHVE